MKDGAEKESRMKVKTRIENTKKKQRNERKESKEQKPIPDNK